MRTNRISRSFMHRLLPAFSPSRNRNTFIERYGWDDTPEVTMRWTRTDLNFKGRPRTSAKELFSFRSLRRRKPDRHGKPSSVCRARPPNNDFQSSICRRDLTAFLVWFLFHRMFSFVRTDSSSISTRSDYPGIIIPLDLKVATDTLEKFGDPRSTPIVSRQSARQSVM